MATGFQRLRAPGVQFENTYTKLILIYVYIYVYLYGNVPFIRDTANLIKCDIRVLGSNTLNYPINHLTFLFASL